MAYQLMRTPTVHTKGQESTEPHSIIIPGGPVIPLMIRGVMSRFNTYRPTQHEIAQSDNFPKIEMTYDSPTYNPEDKAHENIEKELWTQLKNDIVNTLIERSVVSKRSLVTYLSLWI